jgi:hypothetical protein
MPSTLSFWEVDRLPSCNTYTAMHQRAITLQVVMQKHLEFPVNVTRAAEHNAESVAAALFSTRIALLQGKYHARGLVFVRVY